MGEAPIITETGRDRSPVSHVMRFLVLRWAAESAPVTPTSRYRTLDAQRIVETVARLRDRIRERFPDASLGRLAEDLLVVAKDTARRVREIRRPSIPMRLTSAVLLAVAGAALLGAIAAVHPRLDDDWRWADVIQTLESALGALFFLGASIVFVATLEARRRRHRCLHAIHEMRAMAHIVDMHQLTKDPDRLDGRAPDTPSSPRRDLTRPELTRYLDYCSETLSLIGKIAALYVQGFPDSQAIAAVDEVEHMTTGLSRKIWQKIMILDRVTSDAPSSPVDRDPGA